MLSLMQPFPPTVFLWLSPAQHSLTKHALEIMFLFQPLFMFLFSNFHCIH